MNSKLLPIITLFFLLGNCNPQPNYEIDDFRELLLPAPVEGGFKMDDYWVWGGSCIKGEDGKYHLFASRWPKKYPFLEGYVYYSEIIRTVSDNPVGPYHYAETVLPAREKEFWDGRMTHNPNILKTKDRYYLYYIGSSYEKDPPDPEELRTIKNLWQKPAYKNIRIGVASSESVNGPWERKDKPILAPQENGWDSVVVTNPSPFTGKEDEIYMVYRTFVRGEGHRLGLTRAAHPDSVYNRVLDGPINSAQVEDPFIWSDGQSYYIIAKDMTGDITGEKHAGVFLRSDDLFSWKLNDPVKAYSREVIWDDGDTTIQGSLERPSILIENGVPSYLFFATADGPGGFRNADNTWNMVIPLKKPE